MEDDMVKSLNVFKYMSTNVVVYPGHGPSTTVKEELEKQKTRARNARSDLQSMNMQNEEYMKFNLESEFVGYDNLTSNSKQSLISTSSLKILINLGSKCLIVLILFFFIRFIPRNIIT